MRLALAARAITYGQNLVYEGPRFKSMNIEGDTAVITFDNIGGGLIARNGDAIASDGVVMGSRLPVRITSSTMPKQSSRAIRCWLRARTLRTRGRSIRLGNLPRGQSVQQGGAAGNPISDRQAAVAEGSFLIGPPAISGCTGPAGRT